VRRLRTEWLQRPADPQSPQPPSALTSAGQRAHLSRLPALVRIIFNRISRVLVRHNIKSVGLRHMILLSLLRPDKDHFRLRTPGVYSILCVCGRIYIGQTGRSADIRLNEHQRHIRLEHPNKSAVAEHSIDQGHRIQFHNSFILSTETRYMSRIVREASKIKLHPLNINR
jgi:hypothetical protein